MKQEIYFNLGKKIEIEAEECISSWSRFRGLMFRKSEDAPILLFDFKKLARISIHSFFCHKFIAIWLDGKNKVVEIRKVEPWKFSIKPEKNFVKLIEIPINCKSEKIIKFLDFPTETRNI